MGARPGPTPAGYDRFSPVGKRALYMARSEHAALAETPVDVKKPYRLVQRFEVQLHDIEAIRLRPDMEEVAPYLRHLLLQTEHERGIVGNLDPYSAGQFLPELAERKGIGAIEYPAVRGGYACSPRRFSYTG